MKIQARLVAAGLAAAALTWEGAGRACADAASREIQDKSVAEGRGDGKAESKVESKPAEKPVAAPGSGAGRGNTVHIGTRKPPSVLVEAKPLAPIQIDYPTLARKRGLEGVVEVEIGVDEKGTITALRVARSSGHGLLDDAALRGFTGIQFEPARRDGTSVSSTFRQPVRFVLKES
jgi:protein TonB